MKAFEKQWKKLFFLCLFRMFDVFISINKNVFPFPRNKWKNFDVIRQSYCTRKLSYCTQLKKFSGLVRIFFAWFLGSHSLHPNKYDIFARFRLTLGLLNYEYAKTEYNFFFEITDPCSIYNSWYYKNFHVCFYFLLIIHCHFMTVTYSHKATHYLF